MKKYSLQDFLNIKAAFAASFAPDDERIAYLDNSTGTTQVYLANTDGTNVRQITSYDNRIMFCSFIPKRELILFGMDDGGNEHAKYYLYDVLAETTCCLTEHLSAMTRFGSISRDGSLITFASTERNGKDFDSYILNIDTGEHKCIYESDGWSFPCGFSADGKSVIVSNSSSNVSNDLMQVMITDGAARVLTREDNNSQYHSPRWLSDSSGFYFTSNEDSEFSNVAFYDMETDTYETVLEFSWDVEHLSLSGEDDCLIATINDDGYSRFAFIDPLDNSISKVNGIPKGLSMGAIWSNDNKKLAFTFADSTSSHTVRIWDREKQVSWQASPDYQSIPQEHLSLPELAHYESFDNLSIPVFLYQPEQKTEGPVPVVVQIHGGPEGQANPSFNPIVQFLQYNGYAVALPNVRGSSGYGKAYMDLDNVEKRMDSVRDIVSLRDYLAQRPEFDENRIALTGGSYGGYMVLANLAFYPDYWAAGIDIVGISNLVTFLKNTSIWRRAIREAEYGSLENDRELLERISPINKAEQISAPLMIIHGENDPRVPVSEARQMYETLKKFGRDVELLTYPDEGHGLAKLKNRIDAWTKAVNFLDRRLKSPSS